MSDLILPNKKQLITDKHQVSQSFKKYTQKELAQWVFDNYRRNCTQFAVDFTNLFVEANGVINKPYPKQVQFMNLLSPNDRIVLVLKCRQSGFSTAIVAKAFHDGYFGKYPDIVIVSATKTQAVKVMRRIKQCFLDMPEEIRPNFKVDQAQELILGNGTRIVSLSSNPNAMRGWTGIFYLDEFGMHTERESEEIYEAVYPATTKGGRIVAVSTPFGVKGMFYKLSNFSLAEISGNKDVKQESKKFMIYWQDVPFIKEAVEKGGLFDGLSPEMIDQEYNLAFRDANIEEQYFTREFMMATLRDTEGDIPLFTSFTDLGLPVSHINDLDAKLEQIYIRTDLKQNYSNIYAGWDVASTENDSIMVVLGELRDKPKHYEQIGEFFLNRVGKESHNTISQAKYAKKLMQAMCIDKLTIDYTGLGKGAADFLLQDGEVQDRINAFTYRKENKFDGFVRLKQMLADRKIKRRWDGDNQITKQTIEILKQCTNLRLNQLNLTLKAKGNEKDDYPNALMLATDLDSMAPANIFMI